MDYSIKRLLFLIILPLFFLISSVNVHAMPVTDVSGSYGLIKCSNDKVNGLSNCAYVQSYGIIGENTAYTMLEKSSTFAHDHVPYAKFDVFTALYLFPNLNYKNGSFYTLNFEYNQGSYVSTIITTLTKANLVVEAFNGSDYVSGGYTDLNFSADYNDTTKSGHISITFKATTDTTSYRIRIQPGVAIWTNTSSKLAQGVRVFLISANVEENLSNALLNQITNQNETIINQNQQLIDSSKKANEEQKKTNETLTDDTIHGFDGKDFDEINKDSSGPISGLITMPITLLNKFLNGFNGQCQSYSLPPLLGTAITFPCLNLESILGSDIWSKIDGLMCIFMIYQIAMMIISWFEKVTSLQDTFAPQYVPSHSAASEDYIPKHVERW